MQFRATSSTQGQRLQADIGATAPCRSLRAGDCVPASGSREIACKQAPTCCAVPCVLCGALCVVRCRVCCADPVCCAVPCVLCDTLCCADPAAVGGVAHSDWRTISQDVS